MGINNEIDVSLHRGLVPDINSLVATVIVLGTYITRYGVVVEGNDSWLAIPLILTTDFVLPLLASVWLLAVPTWLLYRRIERNNAGE